MFNTMDVAKKIRTIRTQKNMTQMELADEMGVSYQAVSNWERGNSLPDIGKIPDLCRILGISITELLGEEKEADTVAKLVKNEEVEPEKLAEVAPMVPPKQIEENFSRAKENGHEFSLKAILSLLPFLDEEYLDKLAQEAVVESPKDLSAIAPFLSESSLDSLVEQLGEADDESLMTLAPFLSDKALGCLAEKYCVSDIEKLKKLAPFLDDSSLNRIAERLEKIDSENLLALAPFLSSEALDTLAKKCDVSDIEKLTRLAPFLEEDTLDACVENLLKQENCSLDKLNGLAPFLSSKVICKLAKATVKNR